MILYHTGVIEKELVYVLQCCMSINNGGHLFCICLALPDVIHAHFGILASSLSEMWRDENLFAAETWTLCFSRSFDPITNLNAGKVHFC